MVETFPATVAVYDERMMEQLDYLVDDLLCRAENAEGRRIRDLEAVYAEYVQTREAQFCSPIWGFSWLQYRFAMFSASLYVCWDCVRNAIKHRLKLV